MTKLRILPDHQKTTKVCKNCTCGRAAQKEKEVAKENYKQVKLVQPTDDGQRTLITWVPTRFAHERKAVTVEDRPGEWVVEAVYDIVRTRDQLDDQRKSQREFDSKLETHR